LTDNGFSRHVAQRIGGYPCEAAFGETGRIPSLTMAFARFQRKGLQTMSESSTRLIRLLSVAALCLWFTGLVAQAQSAPSITQQPANQTVAPGSSVTLSVAVSGTGPLTYQWQLNGTNLPDYVVTTVAGGGADDPGDGGPAINATIGANIYGVNGLALDASGTLFIADTGDCRIRKVDTNGIITTVAGNGTGGYSGDGGSAIQAQLSSPGGVAVDFSGNLFIGDTGNQRVRTVGTNGIITTLAGNGNPEFFSVYGLAVAPSGDLFIADWLNGFVREINTSGVLSVVAGGGGAGYAGNGVPAYASIFYAPRGVACDRFGNLFIADYNNNLVRKVGTNGIITTVAGVGPSGAPGGYSGDGGPATSAQLFFPHDACPDAVGNLFIADTFNGRIRKVSVDGTISTVAGGGTNYPGDGGAATNVSLNPTAVAVDASGNLLVSDSHRVREVVVTSGPALVFKYASAVSAGTYDLVVSNIYGSVTSSPSVLTVTEPPAIILQPLSLSFSDGQPAVFAVTVIGAAPLAYQWLLNATPLAGDTSATLTLPSVAVTNIGSYEVIVTNAYGSVTSAVATLSGGQPPSITVQSEDLGFTNGNSAGFAVVAGGASPLAYQWFFDGTAVSGATDYGLFFQAEATTNLGSYWVVVTNAYGSVTSSVVTMSSTSTGTTRPAITNQPVSLILPAGNNAAFFVGVAGATPLSYQWLFDGINLTNDAGITGAQASLLTVSAVRLSNQGIYQVIVANAYGSVTSSVVTLSVAYPASVDQTIVITNQVPGSNGPVDFVLGSGAPAGASITTNGIFSWTPSCQQGSTTNVITVWAVNTANPPASNSTSFTVVVADCVQVSIGYCVVQTGQTASVPMNLLSTVALTNLSFTLAYPSGHLTNWDFGVSNSVIGPPAILSLNPSQTEFNFPTTSGPLLPGASLIGLIGFGALGGPSAFVPLAATGISATRTDGSIFTNGIGQPGRIVVIGTQPLLDARLSNNSAPMLTLYGNPPDTYQISSSTNVTGTVVWTPFTNVTLTNLFEFVTPPASTNQMEFFRAMQQ
jgi:hypothetical protein